MQLTNSVLLRCYWNARVVAQRRFKPLLCSFQGDRALEFRHGALVDSVVFYFFFGGPDDELGDFLWGHSPTGSINAYPVASRKEWWSQTWRTPFISQKRLYIMYELTSVTVGDGIFTPNDTISAQKRTNSLWAAIRGAHKISKKTNQGTKGNTSGLIHRRSYADVAAAPA